MASHDEKMVAIFMRERAGISRYLSRRAGSAEDGEDLAQEAWIRFSQSKAMTLVAPVPYLRRLVKNLAIDHSRSAHRRRLHSHEVDELLNVDDNRPNPEAVLISRDTLSRLFEIMDELPARRRAILFSARVEGEAHRQIAATHGVSTRTVELEIRAAIEYCFARLNEPIDPEK
ncbi:sigma-70 family RNA polymerase sigma factor [Agrobacterium tumefaciens]|uniref:sigma-70 family RNA polymerase sigma factor n=1 Tax=Agrobacterium tumefaciens TaxID=358 RepID=UPI0009BBE262|nr:sigma-70 family RNA polymerase sigma factor [Agrobacterium tumefaciens]